MFSFFKGSLLKKEEEINIFVKKREIKHSHQIKKKRYLDKPQITENLKISIYNY